MPTARLAAIQAGVPAAGSTSPSPATASTTGSHMIHQGSPQRLALQACRCSSIAIFFWIRSTGAE